MSLASISLLPYASRETFTSLGSDHLPIVITLETDIKLTESKNRTYTNFKKANWELFTQETELAFSKLPSPSNIYPGEKTFRRILTKSSKRAIPSGRIKDIIPEVPTEIADKWKTRDELRQTDPTAPELTRLNQEIDSGGNNYKRDKWRETVSNINRKVDSSKLFKLIKYLNGGAKANSNQAIKFKGKYISDSKQLADHFNKQFSSVKSHASSKTNRKITRSIKKLNQQDQTKFSPHQTSEAIKKARASKALGPDGLSTLHLKNLGPSGAKFLTDLFNLSTSSSIIPAIWKTSIIIPLLKPSKPSDDSTSYRPVSLLCPAIKILERLILPTLTEHLPVPPHQHGFRSKHSTVTALNDFNQKISEGFNKRKPADRTVLLQIDLSKAFDMVSHEKLLTDLYRTTLPDSIKRWFNSYLHGRQSRVNFRDATSSTRNVKTGVPQGAVTSPILFNFYLSLLPLPPEGVYIVQYADDISVYTCGTNIQQLTNSINSYIKEVLSFLSERELEVSPSKSTVTLFTPDTHEALIHPKVEMEGTTVKLDRAPKLLGVTFDTMHSFSAHIKASVTKARGKVNILKALAGSAWGQDKETLILTYKSICRSTLEYGVPIWGPLISQTNWQKLQTVQNQALRTATGCLAMASHTHLHRECKVLPLKEHGDLLTKQFLAQCFLPSHPGNKQLN